VTALLLSLALATTPTATSTVSPTPTAAAGAVAGGGYGYAPLAQSADGVDVVERLGEPVPTQLRFYDAFHNDVALRDFLGRGKPVVVTLVYFECPMLCSLVLKGLVKGLNETGLQLGKDYAAITASFDPKDTPRAAGEAQRGYLASLSRLERARSEDWPFLTGGEANIRAFAEALGFKYRYDAPTAQFAHPAVAFVLTPEGRISRYLYGIEFPGRDLRLSLVEASGGRVGTSFDRVLLKCFRYDPGTGRYRVYAINFVRAGAFASFLGLVVGLSILWRQEWKRKRSRG
jgi:protein SCO1/2